MTTFKQFLIERIVGNAGWVYHRTKENPEDSEILTKGIRPSSNLSALYGKGLYTCYDFDQQLKSDMKKYGRYILKGKVDLNGFAILDEDIYRIANPRGDFEKHLKEIGTNLIEAKDRSILPYTSRIAQRIWKKCKQNGYNGIIFTGETDGKVAVIWNRRNFIPYQYTEDEGETWKKINPNISSIKRKEDPNYDKDDEKVSLKKYLKELSLREKFTGDITIPYDYKGDVNIKNLKIIEGHFACYGDVEKINLPDLERMENFINVESKKVETLSMPKLKNAVSIFLKNVHVLDFPSLSDANTIEAENATTINLPELKDVYIMHIKNAIYINVPKLDLSPIGMSFRERFICPNAKKIIVKRQTRDYFILSNPDCEIIYSD